MPKLDSAPCHKHKVVVLHTRLVRLAGEIFAADADVLVLVDATCTPARTRWTGLNADRPRHVGIGR